MKHTYYYIAQAETGYGCSTYGETESYNVCGETTETTGTESSLANTGQTIVASTAFSLLVIGISVYLFIKTKKGSKSKDQN